MKRTIHLLLLFTVWAAQLHAQGIEISLPHFAGKEYVFALPKGLSNDTIASGILDNKGNAIIIIPEKYQTYRGMGQFRFLEGGGLDLIVAGGENYKVSCTEEIPTIENLKITGSPENSFVTKEFLKEQELRSKAQVLDAVLQTYGIQDVFFKQAQTEQQKIKKQQQAYETSVKTTPLYAGSFLQLSKYLDDVATAYLKQNEELENIREYGVEDWNVEAMYTSGLWYHIIDYWVAMYRDYVTDDDALPRDVVKILSRIQTQEVFEEFATNLLTISEQNNWSKTTFAIGDYLSTSKRLDNRSRQGLKDAARMSLTSPGKPAPALIGNFGRVIPLRGHKTIVIFYETGCDHCEKELQELKQNYESLKEKGYEVVSVSADLDKEIYEIGSAFPWPVKLCDFKGFEGVNFEKYALLGTPTIFVVDEYGIIQGRYAHFSEVML